MQGFVKNIKNLYPPLATACMFTLLAGCAVRQPPPDSMQLDKDWTSANQSGLDAMSNGNYHQAETYFQQAENDARNFGATDPRLPATYNNLASAYEKQSKYVQAEQTYKEALPLFQKIMGPQSTASAIVMLNLSRVDALEGKLDEAGPYCRDAIDIKEKNLGPDNPEVADAVQQLAGLYEKQGKYSMAIPLYKRAIKVRVRALGKDDPSVVESLDGFARCLRKTDHNPEAAEIEKIAGDLRKKAANHGSTQKP